MGSWGGGGGERDERGTSERERESDRRGEPYAPMCGGRALLPLPSLAADGPLKMDKRGWNATRIMFVVKR